MLRSMLGNGEVYVIGRPMLTVAGRFSRRCHWPANDVQWPANDVQWPAILGNVFLTIKQSHIDRPLMSLAGQCTVWPRGDGQCWICYHLSIERKRVE